jgi:hypothetical protein
MRCVGVERQSLETVTLDPGCENIFVFSHKVFGHFQVNLKTTLEFMHPRRYTGPGAFKQKGPRNLTFREL